MSIRRRQDGPFQVTIKEFRERKSDFICSTRTGRLIVVDPFLRKAIKVRQAKYLVGCVFYLFDYVVIDDEKQPGGVVFIPTKFEARDTVSET